MHQLPYQFIDVKKAGVEALVLHYWIHRKGLDTVVNRNGTTYKKLTDADKGLLADENQAILLLKTYPSMIRRPVIVHEQDLFIGYAPEEWEHAFISNRGAAT